MDFKKLSRFPPFLELKTKTRESLLAGAYKIRSSLPESTPSSQRFCFQTLGGRTTDILSPSLLPLAAASGIRSIRFLLPGAQPVDPLQRKLTLFSGWTPTDTSRPIDLSGPGISILSLPPPFLALLESALNECIHDADKDLLRAVISILLIDCDAFFFDVQAGPGTHFPDFSRAEEAAHTLHLFFEHISARSAVMIRELYRPVGRAFGDGLEIRETVSALRGSAPFALLKILFEYGAEIMSMTGIRRNKVEARIFMKDILLSRQAASLFRDAVENGGGDFKPWDDPGMYLQTDGVFSIPVERGGYFHGLNVPVIAQVMDDLRKCRPEAGFMLLKSPGDHLKNGENVFSVFAYPEAMSLFIQRNLTEAVDIRSAPPPYHPLIRVRLK